MKHRLDHPMIRLGLIGDPVAHSLSPALHAAAAEAAGLHVSYPLLSTTVSALPARLNELRQAGHRGFNATAPLKVALLELMDRVAPCAARVGAINTVCFEAGQAVGANTDLSAYGARIAAGEVAQGPAIVLGAGGAARAALVALHDAALGPIWLLARRTDAAAALANELNIHCEIKPLHQFHALLGSASLVVGCLPEDALPGLRGVDWRASRPELRLIESGYTAGARAWVAEAAASGRRAEDGVPLLVAQGVAAFARFTGQLVAEAPVLSAVRAGLMARQRRGPAATAPHTAPCD